MFGPSREVHTVVGHGRQGQARLPHGRQVEAVLTDDRWQAGGSIETLPPLASCVKTLFALACRQGQEQPVFGLGRQVHAVFGHDREVQGSTYM